MSTIVNEHVGRQEAATFAERVRPSIPDPSRIRDATESFTLKDFDREIPDDSWDDVDLVAYAKHQAQIVRMLKRTTAIHVYRLGRALAIYRSRHLEHGDWEKFLKDEGIAGPTAWRAIQLYQRTKSEEEVADLGITEAYLHFGILRKAKEKSEKRAPGGDEKTPAEAGAEAPAEVVPAVAASRTKPAEPIEDEADSDSGEAQSDDEEPEGQGEQAEELGAETEAEHGAEAVQPENADADTPPPKESWTAVSALVAAKRALEWLEEKITSGEWDHEDKDDYRSRLEQIIEIAMRIEDALS